jgi:hypothetical protein
MASWWEQLGNSVAVLWSKAKEIALIYLQAFFVGAICTAMDNQLVPSHPKSRGRFRHSMQTSYTVPTENSVKLK